MSTPKHTPGPWVFHGPGSGDKALPITGAHREYVGSDGLICEVYYDDVTTEGAAEQEANARLIAAAPDVLEALQECAVTLQSITDSFNGEDMIDLGTDGVVALNRARAAIARATGGSDADDR